MRNFFFISFITCSSVIFGGNPHNDSLARKAGISGVARVMQTQQLCRNVVGRYNSATNWNENYIFDRSLYFLKVDTLPQIRFWRDIMKLHEDSAIINIGNNRSYVEKVNMRTWDLKSDLEKKNYRDSVRIARNLDSSYKILITTGKRFFYDFERASLSFQKGIHCFIENNVDPWYAQAILLIESPNKLQKSNVGAYGPFQLMKDVARMYGLKVNKHQDERADFARSAFAASSLIKNICIPRACRMLDSLKITHYSEDDLWFKLLVMHIYHAGAYNVQKALYSFNPAAGNMDMIYTLWRTQTAKFKSASQNYSQIVLAAMLEMNERGYPGFQAEESTAVR
jgi:hypothetical protein